MSPPSPGHWRRERGPSREPSRRPGRRPSWRKSRSRPQTRPMLPVDAVRGDRRYLGCRDARADRSLRPGAGVHAGACRGWQPRVAPWRQARVGNGGAHRLGRLPSQVRGDDASYASGDRAGARTAIQTEANPGAPPPLGRSSGMCRSAPPLSPSGSPCAAARGGGPSCGGRKRLYPLRHGHLGPGCGGHGRDPARPWRVGHLPYPLLGSGCPCERRAAGRRRAGGRAGRCVHAARRSGRHRWTGWRHRSRAEVSILVDREKPACSGADVRLPAQATRGMPPSVTAPNAAPATWMARSTSAPGAGTARRRYSGGCGGRRRRAAS